MKQISPFDKVHRNVDYYIRHKHTKKWRRLYQPEYKSDFSLTKSFVDLYRDLSNFHASAKDKAYVTDYYDIFEIESPEDIERIRLLNLI